MGKYNYNQIVKVAKNCQKVVKKEKKLGITSKWAYFFAKAITEPQKAYNQFNYPQSPNPVNRHVGVASGNLSVSTTISGSDASSPHNNMPPYMKVYMWKRTA